MVGQYAIGDIHGHFDKLVALLQRERFIDDSLAWIAGKKELYFLGDFGDRGPCGVDVIKLVMRLELEAARAGGKVCALLGNHDLLLLAAYYVRTRANFDPTDNLYEDWLFSGGRPHNLEQLSPEQLEWLETLPAMRLVGNTLLMHADANFYQLYGRNIAKVNAEIRGIVRSKQTRLWGQLLYHFSERNSFFRAPSPLVLERFLQAYGATRIVHGHTPICAITPLAAHEVRQAFSYAQNRCVNIDHGLYMGGEGFIYRLDQNAPEN